MATDNSATIIPLHQPKRPKTPAERARAYRLRKKAGGGESRPPDPVTVPARVTPVTPRSVTASRWPLASILLTGTALMLAGVGIVMNGAFARSLGSTELSGWLFLGVGIAADLVALAVPACAAGLWQARRRATALAGWGIWATTFVFVLMAGVGFASVSISDVTASRASRITPAVTSAQAALADAQSSRDRECRGGVGRFCREREAVVAERQQALTAAQRTVEQAADPQIEAASRIVAWVSAGSIRPTGEDFGMLRLILLAILPQFGGLLLMVGRLAK